jgi:hypothetical protein
MEPGSHALIAVGTAVVAVTHSYYELADFDGGDEIPPDAGVSNGFVAPGSTGANILTGLFWGPVTVTVEIHAAAPALDLDGWEDVVETSLFTDSGTIRPPIPRSEDAPPLPPLNTTPSSWFRIRAHARGREAARDILLPPADPPEEHLLQLWPAPQTDEVIHR